MIKEVSGNNRETPAAVGKSGWVHFAHEADVGISGFGPTLDDAFEQAALALIAAVTDVPVESTRKIRISLREERPDDLFVAWLNELVFEMAAEGMIFATFDVHISGNELNATVWGEPVDQKKHHPACEVKGATYTELSVAQNEDGIWTARCVVDV